MYRWISCGVVVFVSSILIPAAAYAQASVTGVVRDTSGAVLPGVTVEAASPALIEKVRTAVTDGSGQYRIENLRPGSYSVTFTLPGFATVKREGVELAGSFTATINADLRVGALEETITVTGETPTVDVQNTTQQRVLDHDLIDAIPTGRSERNLAVLIPGLSIGNTTGGTAVSSVVGQQVINQDVGGVQDFASINLSVHGGRSIDQRITQNGLSFGSVACGGSNTLGITDMGAMQEVAIDTGATSAELATGGVRITLIPKDGGNTYSGGAFAAFANSSFQGNNFTEELRAGGLRSPDELKRLWDINPSFGGPIKADKLWFFASYKNTKAETYAAGTFKNLNANNPAVWAYAPDFSSRPFSRVDQRSLQARLTWQATQKLKVSLHDQEQYYCGCTGSFLGISATVAPEAGTIRDTHAMRNLLAEWTAPLTNRLLVDGGFIHRKQPQRSMALEEYASDPNYGLMIPVTEQALGNLQYRAIPQTARWVWYKNFHYRTSVSYITGAHALKAGVTFSRLAVTTWQGNQTPGANMLQYRFNNGVPNQITLNAHPYRIVFRAPADVGLFVQDKWTLGRLTASVGLRYDYWSTSFPEQTLGPTSLLPTRNITFPETKGVSLHDIAPKTGLAYDVFGTGKTALKVSLNKYLEGMGSGGALGNGLNPVSLVGTTTTRAWNDANVDYRPDCDLINPAANGECGALADQNFGRQRPSASYDPDILSGWDIRGYNWEFSTGVQQELMPRVSMDVMFFRRWYGNFLVTDNRATTAADYTAFSVTAPSTDARLPSSGQVISGYFDLNPNRVGQVDNLITKASNYGKQSEAWTGVDLNVTARLDNGLLLHGGTSGGRTATNNCEIREKLPEMGLTNPFCDAKTPYLTQFKVLATYLVPRIGVQLGGTLQNIPGPMANALFVASNAMVAPSLGRPLSGNAANVTVPLIQPDSLTADRITQLDLRVGKVFRTGNVRSTFSLDIYNALNTTAVLGVLSSFGGVTPWQQPIAILQARLFKLSAQFDF